MTWPQIDLYARRIARRRRERAADWLGIIRAAQWGDETALTQMRAQLLGESEREVDTTAQLAGMGITVITREPDV